MNLSQMIALALVDIVSITDEDVRKTVKIADRWMIRFGSVRVRPHGDSFISEVIQRGHGSLHTVWDTPYGWWVTIGDLKVSVWSLASAHAADENGYRAHRAGKSQDVATTN